MQAATLWINFPLSNFFIFTHTYYAYNNSTNQ